ncbi:MAG: hypothetical protein WB762_03355 [Candidatus Sulfotelmatobacter sp.]
MRIHKFRYALLILFALPLTAQTPTSLCLDGLCIGESINDPRFSEINWIVPNKEFAKESCIRIACRPEVAFRGYPSGTQKQLADSLSWVYGSIYFYNVVTKANVEVLRHYQYECSNRERHFMGAYYSNPSHYLTIVGLRLIGGELRIYRIVRQYPYHNQDELMSLARKLHGEYGDRILFYDGIASNAYSAVAPQRKDGWFAHSTLFNPRDPSDNAAELALIDPRTRPFLQPMEMPESGDISRLSVTMPEQCSRSLPLQ